MKHYWCQSCSLLLPHCEQTVWAKKNLEKGRRLTPTVYTVFYIPYMLAYTSPFFNFRWSKVWWGGLSNEHKTKTVFSESKFWHDFWISEEGTIHPYYDELDDVAVDFLFEEISEPEEMTDDDFDFSPWELKIEFIPRKFIQFTLIKFYPWFRGGGHTVNQQFPFQNWGGAYTPEYTVRTLL